ncbi:MAG: hypothetical protein U0Y10_05990 [Spirosomataceae bacterium]
MKKVVYLAVIFLGMYGAALAQNEEEAIKRTVESEAKALKSHQPDVVRRLWKFDKNDTHAIINVSLPNGFQFHLSGIDLANDAKFPPADNVTVKNSGYRIRIDSSIAYASYETTQTKPDGSFVKSHRVDMLEKVGNEWKIVEVSEHYYLPK